MQQRHAGFNKTAKGRMLHIVRGQWSGLPEAGAG